MDAKVFHTGGVGEEAIAINTGTTELGSVLLHIIKGAWCMAYWMDLALNSLTNESKRLLCRYLASTLGGKEE